VTLASAVVGTADPEPADDRDDDEEVRERDVPPERADNGAARMTVRPACEGAATASRGAGDGFAPVTNPGSLKAAIAAPANAIATTMVVRVLLTRSPADADAL